MAVKTYLESLGLTAGRLSTEGASTSNPVASNNTRAGRKQNRRVEISSKECNLPQINTRKRLLLRGRFLFL